MTGTGEPKTLDFRSRGEWRQWLVRNHAKSQGEWVYMYKKSAREGLRYQEALDEALCFGWIDGQIKAVDRDRFKQRWTPRRLGSIWSRVNKAKVKRLTAEGRMTEAGLAAVKTARKTGKWQAAYSNQRPSAVPPDLVKALQADATAWQGFKGLAPSYRRIYAGWSPTRSSPRLASGGSQRLCAGRAKAASQESRRCTSDHHSSAESRTGCRASILEYAILAPAVDCSNNVFGRGHRLRSSASAGH